jgi:hypothetical protein
VLKLPPLFYVREGIVCLPHGKCGGFLFVKSGNGGGFDGVIRDS